MRTTLIGSLLLCLATLSAQDVLHYKFDGGCGADVINFAPGAGNGTLVTTTLGGPNAARLPGQFGMALGGSGTSYGFTHVATGWAPSTSTGNFSIAMWLNHRAGSGSIGFGYLLGASGSNFRIFTGASGKLFLNGMPSAATSGTDLTSLLNAGWVHVACTVDSTAMQAVWYVNGSVDATVSLNSPVALTGTNLTIGTRNNSHSPLSTDEFLFTESVLSPTDVLTLALSSYPKAGAGAYTVANQCGAGNVDLVGVGVPNVGSTTFYIEASTVNPSLVLTALGFSRCQFAGTLPLPLDAGLLSPAFSGCYVVANPLVAVNGVTTAGVPFPLPIAIPSGIPVITIYAQAVALDLVSNVPSMSNGLAIGVGF